MLWFKQLLAFPLYAHRRVADLGAAAADRAGRRVPRAARPGAGRVRGLDLWPYPLRRAGRTAARHRRRRDRASPPALAVAATLAPAAAPAASGSRRTGDGLAYESFGAARLDRLVAERNAGLCQSDRGVVHHLSRQRAHPLDSDAVRRAFAAREIVPLKGDWTRQDPEITALLQKFGRSGVPLYLLYDRDRLARWCCRRS